MWIRRSPSTRDRPSVIPNKPLERLPKLTYSLLKDNALKKKFGELGIPSWGSRSLMIRRHTEWVNLWNANCDSSRPRSKRELLQELDIWERSQGGHAPSQGGAVGGPSSVMRKDFDGAGWVANHEVDFKQLISSARATRGPPNGSAQTTLEESRGPSEGSAKSSEDDQPPSTGQKSCDYESIYLLDPASVLGSNQSHGQCPRILNIFIVSVA